MSGHSKWATIKHKKSAQDAKKGKLFSKLAREITIAVKLGGPDPESNSRLRTVLLACRSANMPKENIERAIKRGSGEGGENYEEVRYECYGPAGVALVVDVLTDNKRRTVADVRHVVTKHGGSMAEAGAVMWNFEQKGLITVPKNISEEEIMEKAIEAGAEDVDTEGDMYEVYTAPNDLHAVLQAFEKMNMPVNEAKLTLKPKNLISVDSKSAAAVLKLMEALEDMDDVQDVYTNLNITDEALAEAMAE
ncbi:MAG: YebC/PmpR family DNA-binding transcriptional regulator [Candidatus Hydrogenedentes bacterium]|nr:YebC/PmpR family DNA-binding transcriptional regulator [Candidatus Hydrogenedentota bacterium]